MIRKKGIYLTLSLLSNSLFLLLLLLLLLDDPLPPVSTPMPIVPEDTVCVCGEVDEGDEGVSAGFP